MNAFLARADGLLQKLSVPRNTVGASVFRWVAGSTLVYQYAVSYGARHYLFGPHGVFPWVDFLSRLRGFSLYAVSDSPAWFEGIFHLGMLVTFAWTLGLWTLVTGPLVYVFFWSLHQRNPFLWDGGDNLIQILLVYACVANVASCFAVSPRTFAKGVSRKSAWVMTQGLLHNLAMGAFAMQVCTVYVVAGLNKVQGESWRNGTALYYALRAHEFFFPGLSQVVWSNAWALTLLAYLTVGFQVSFPFLLTMNRWTRLGAIGVGISFHLGIMVMMGLKSFAAFMIAADLALLSDGEYAQWGRWVNAARSTLYSKLSPLRA